MADFEEELRAAFDDELRRMLTPPNLRRRVISRAVKARRAERSPERRQRIRSTAAPRAASAVAVLVLVTVTAVALGTHLIPSSPPVAKHGPIVLAFGKLPEPALRLPIGLGGGGGTSSPGAAVPYFGPARLTWSGTVPKVPVSAPVFRFVVPGPKEADRFAAELGAHPSRLQPEFQAQEYDGPGSYQMTVRFADPNMLQPFFRLTQTARSGPVDTTESGARIAADGFLNRYHLQPTWPAEVAVTPRTEAPAGFDVSYERLVNVASVSRVPCVDATGDPSGLALQIDASGQVVAAEGPLPTAEQQAEYPLRNPATAVPKAVTAPALDAGAGPVPVVALARVELVYIVATAGSTGYLEPAYLFSGTFTQNGLRFEKRVLISALAPAALAA